MANNDSTIFSFGADISDLQKKIEEAKKEIASMRALSANSMVTVANEANKQAELNIKKAEQNLKHAEQKVAEKERRLQETVKALEEAEKKLENEQKAAKSRAENPDYIVTSDPAVKASQKAVITAQRDLKKSQNDLSKADKEAANAKQKLQKENYKVRSAENVLQKAQANSASATIKHTQAVKNYTDALEKANYAKEKLDNGGNIVSDTAFRRAKKTANIANDRVNQQQGIVEEQSFRVEQAKASVNVANKAYEQALRTTQGQNNARDEISLAETRYNSAVNKLEKESEKLDAYNTELMHRMSSANDAQQKVINEAQKLQKANNEKLNKLNDQVTNADIKAKKAETQKIVALDNERQAEEKLADAIKRRDSAAAKATQTQNAVSQKADIVNDKQTVANNANNALKNINANAIESANQKILNAANTKVTQAKDAINAAKRGLDGAKTGLEQAAQSLENAKLKSTQAKVRIDNAEANAKIANLKTQLANVEKTHNVPVRSDGIEHLLRRLATVTIAFEVIQKVSSKIANIISGIAGSGYEYVKTMESARIGIAGIYASLTEIDGKRTTYQQGLGIANDVVNRLQQAAAVTAATPTDMIRTFQGLAGPGLGAGMDTDQLIQYTKVGVNAAKSMQLPATQFIQELRDMVQGGIQPASSTIATALGLKDADIERMKNSADGLFKSLMDKMVGLAEGADMYTQTIMGKEELLKQTFIQTGAVFSSTFETEIKGVLDTLSVMMADVNLKTGEFKINPAIVEFIEQLKNKVLEFMDVWGNFDTDTGIFTPNQETIDAWESICSFLEDIKNLAFDISEMFIAWSPAIVSLTGGLGKALDMFMNILDAVINNVTWLGKVVSASDTAKAIIEDIGILLGTQGILHVLGLLFKLVKSLTIATWAWQAAAKAVNVILNITKAKEKAILALKTAQAVITTAMANPAIALALGIGATGAAVGAASGAFDGVISKIQSGFKTIGDKLMPEEKGNDGEEKDADYYEKLSEKRLKALGYNKDTDPYAASKAMSINRDKTDDKEVKKAAKEQLQANKQALKQQTELIKENQEKKLTALKDTMESIQVAFDDVRIDWQQYSAEKAENEIQQQQVKVDAIKAEIEATKNSSAFQSQDELSAALSKLNKTLSKETTTLEKLITSQEDVANVIAFYSQQSTTPYTDEFNRKANQTWSNASGPMPENIPLDAFGGDVAQWLMHYYVSHGIPKDIAAGLVGNQRYESDGFNPNAISGDGYGSYGLSQFTGNRLNGYNGLLNWAKQNGLDASDLRNQAAFTIEELLNRGYLAAIKESMAAGNSATIAVRKKYEVPDPSVANDAQRIEYANEALTNYQETAKAMVDSAGQGLEAGLEAGFAAWDGQTMQNGRNGCVEAVTRIGSWYSDFLNKEFGNFSVPALKQNAKTAGIPEIPYDEERLKPGDVIVYDTDEHVLIYKGKGKTVGNSSGKNKVVEQGIDIGLTPTSIIQTGTYGVATNMQTGAEIIPTTKAGLEAKNRAKEARKRAQDITKQYQELYGDVSTIPIEQLIEELTELKKKLINDGRKTEAREIDIVLAAKRNQLEFKTQANYLKLAMDTVEENASDLVYKIADNMYDASDMAQKYLDYYMKGQNYPVNDPRIKDSEKFDIRRILDNYRKQLDEALSNSDLKTSWEIEKSIRSIQNSLVGMLDKFAQAVKDKASWRNSMIDANKQLTTGQKERAKKQVEFDTNKQEAKINRAAAQWYYEQAKQIPLDIKTGKPSNENEYKRLIALSDLRARQAAYNEELTRTYTLLEQTGFVAKQALEDGLLTFLTDSVNQCQSLEEALSNLAITILKELQKMFAKSIIADLMDTWFPQKNNEGNATTEAYIQTMDISAKIGELGQTLAITAESFQMEAVSAAEAWNNALSNVTTNFIAEINAECARLQMAASTVSVGANVSSADVATETVESTTLKRASGGYISGPGTGTSDSIPAMLSNGEYVVKANAVRKYGRAMLDQLNSGSFGNLRVRIPKFATGGYVGQKGSTAVSDFSSSFGATVSPQLHVNNYVDGKRIFDTYGKDIVRSEVQNSMVKNAKFFAETLRRV